MNTVINVNLTHKLGGKSATGNPPRSSSEISFQANRAGNVEVVLSERGNDFANTRPVETLIGTIRKEEARAIVNFFSQLL